MLESDETRAVLTFGRHFMQAGFRALMQDPE
jgi:hypothetical protein